MASLEYPQPYPPDLRCNYSIRVERGLTLHLKFLEPFEIDDHQQVHCPYDQLQVQPSRSLRASLPPLPLPSSSLPTRSSGQLGQEWPSSLMGRHGKRVLGIPLLLQLRTCTQSRITTTTTIPAQWGNV